MLEAKAKDSGARVLNKKVFKNCFQAISKRRNQTVFPNFPRDFWRFPKLYNFKNEQIPTIVVTDANAHHTIWRSSDINPRVEDLLAYCVSADLGLPTVPECPGQSRN